MRPVDYERIAASYDRRYATNTFDGIEQCLRAFLGDARSIAEVGCGTGHWLALAASLPQSPYVIGLDRAFAMLAAARVACPDADLLQGAAEQLPYRAAAFERLFCVNALHHFSDRAAFYGECARVLGPGAAFLTIGLDPHARDDHWWIYDYFPEALIADRERYPSARSIRAGLRAAGFVRTQTVVAQHVSARVPFNEAKSLGLLERSSTSQLLVIGDAAWARGSHKIAAEQPALHADLRLYATVAWQR